MPNPIAPIDHVALLAKAIHDHDVATARYHLNNMAFTRGASFEVVYPLCRTLRSLSADDDTLGSISYGLWEVGLPQFDHPRPDVVVFLIDLMSTSNHPMIHQYCTSMLSDYVESWPEWELFHYNQLLSISERQRDEATQMRMQSILGHIRLAN
jgi:hypothetical protein